MHARFLARRALAGEGAGLAGGGLEADHEALGRSLAETGADASEIDEVLAPMHADEEGAQTRAVAAPAADHHLVARAAFRLGPGIAAAGGIGRAEPFGDDAFQRHAAGGFENSFAAFCEVLDIADERAGPETPAIQQFGQGALSFLKGKRAQIFSPGEEKVEGKKDKLIALPLRECCLKHGKIRRALVIEGGHLPVDKRIGQAARGPGDRGELACPVEARAGEEFGLAIFHAQLDAIAVEFDLMHPTRPGGWPLDRAAKLGFDEIRKRRRLCHPARQLLGAQGFFTSRARRFVVPFRRFGLPHRIGLGAFPGCQHEGLGAFAPARGDVGHLAAGGNRAVDGEQAIAVARLRAIVLVLDQQPVGALATRAVKFHAHEDPAAAEPLAEKREFEIARRQGLLGRAVAFGNPVTAIPELDRSPAILALWNRTFEVAVIEWMILDFKGQTLVMGIERRAAGHRPGLEDAVQFEAEVVVQAGGVMLLDDVAQARGIGDRRLAAGFRGFLEIALGAIWRELPGGHEAVRR